MELKESIRKRRIGVMLTLISLAAIASIFEYGRIEQWNIMLQITEIILFVVFVVSLVLTFLRTGLWRFTHKPLKYLDEREIALTSKSLRYAYAFFAVIVLILLLSFSLLERPVHIVIVVSLILFAHLLPAAVIAWTEKQIKEF
ncbi:MAG: hypothetical protein ABFS05_10735 [Bacteroidota bacterium]